MLKASFVLIAVCAMLVGCASLPADKRVTTTYFRTEATGFAIGHYRGTHKQGRWVFFDRHGSKRVVGHFEQGTMDGGWQFFDADGSSWKVEYLDGHRLSPNDPPQVTRPSATRGEPTPTRGRGPQFRR